MCEETVFWDLNYSLVYEEYGTEPIKKRLQYPWFLSRLKGHCIGAYLPLGVTEFELKTDNIGPFLVIILEDTFQLIFVMTILFH